jgi:hypothetical protein
VGGKPAASAQFLLNPDSSARAIYSEAGETWVNNLAAEFCLKSIFFMLVRFFYVP